MMCRECLLYVFSIASSSPSLLFLLLTLNPKPLNPKTWLGSGGALSVGGAVGVVDVGGLSFMLGGHLA